MYKISPNALLLLNVIIVTLLFTLQNDIEKQFELHNTKKFKAMRDLIVSNIKQFILFMQERGTTIDMQCIVNKRNKNVTKQIAIKQELDTIGTNQFTVKVPEVEFDYSKSFSNHQDLIQEIDNIFTANKISISVVTSLIHVSKSDKCGVSKFPNCLIIVVIIVFIVGILYQDGFF